ncbi:MAG: hypothetical protein GXX85_09020 [Ignavibacteria bacterium]|nr:hypothetical protein [Ignavibacteria bacterium]
MKILILLLVINLFHLINAQDSLHLVKTYTGTTVNKLTGANSLGDINGDSYDDYCVIFRD